MKLQVGNFNISYIDDNFKEWFGEPEIEPIKVELFEKKLPRGMTDKEILDELKPSEITLNELVGFLPRMDRNLWYLAYIQDAGGVLRVIGVFWNSDGWGVSACSVADSGRWGAGSRVLFRNSFNTSEPLKHSDTLPDTITINGVEYIRKKYETKIS